MDTKNQELDSINRNQELDSINRNQVLDLKYIEVGVCIKSSEKRVLFQNRFCQETCGNQQGDICPRQGCLSLYQFTENCKALDEGIQLFKSVNMREQYFDVAIINNGENLMTVYYPLTKKYKRQLNYLQEKGLSKREMQIMAMVAKGATNSEIGTKLSISKATLKTHLNNIYKKLPKNSGIEFQQKRL